MLLILVVVIQFFVNTARSALASGNATLITIPVSGAPPNSTILDSTTGIFTVTARTLAGANAGDSEIIFVDLYSSGTCEVGFGAATCQVICYPHDSPHTKAAQCQSSPSASRVISASSAYWVPATVVSGGVSMYNVSFHDGVQISGTYEASVMIGTVGGLNANYWDNIWFIGTAAKTTIDSQISFDWGTGALTTYGTDYASVRWSGKIKPPYSEEFTFYLTADDGSRMWIDKILIIDAWDRCCNETWGSATLTSTNYHDIIVEYREIRGTANILLQWSSASIAKTTVPSTYLYSVEHISGSPFSNVYIGPGSASYFQSFVQDTTPFASNVAGVNNSVLVTAKDAFGNNIDADTVTFNNTDLDGMTTTSVYLGSGVYRVTFQSNTKHSSGTSFHIRMGPNDINSSPFTVYVSPASTSPQNTTFNGTGLTSATAGTLEYITVIVFDEFGNEREVGSDTILLRFYGQGPGHGVCAYLSTPFGVYSCGYTLTEVGNYNIEFTINTVIYTTATLGPVAVSAGAIHGPSCTFTSNVSSFAAGTQETLSITSRDQFSNVISGTSDTYVVSVVSTSTTLYGNVTAMGSGVYDAQFTPTVKGSYSVSILLDGTTHVLGSPYALTITPGSVSAANTIIASGTGHTTGVSGVQQTFSIQLRDANDNNLETTGTFSTNQIVCAGTTTSISCTYSTGGLYACSYTPTTSGACTTTIQIGGSHISGSPFSATISPGVIDADTSTAIGIGNGVAGVQQSFTIQAKDASANNLTSGSHTIAMYLVDQDGVYPSVAGTVTANNDGTYAIAYTTNLANTYEAINVQLTESGGLRANYYTDIAFVNLFGSATNLVDTTLNFDWGHSIPLTGFPSGDYFSVIWDGFLYPPYTKKGFQQHMCRQKTKYACTPLPSETYTIYVPLYALSGVQVTVSGTVIIDELTPVDGPSDPFGKVQMTQNVMYPITIKFIEQTGAAKISLEWETATISRTVVPKTSLYYTKNVGGSTYMGNVSIIPAATSAAQIAVTGALTSASAGFTEWITIVAKDGLGNVQTDAGNEENDFELYLIEADGSRVNGTVTHAGNSGTDGRYYGSYVLVNTTTYSLYLLYKSTSVSGTPTTVTVSPGNLSSSTSSAVLSNGRAGEIQAFTLYVTDSESNLCQCGGPANDITIVFTNTHTDSSTVTASSITESSGTTTGVGTGIFTITYNATKSGTYTPSITINGSAPISTITGSVSISVAIASASATYIQGWASGPSGSITSTVAEKKIIQVVDIYGNLETATGGYKFYITLVKNDNTSTTRGTVTDAIGGTYNISFTAPSTGTFTLNVMLASGDINTPDGLTGAYYNNRWLYGTPIQTKVDAALNLDWNTTLVTPTAKDYVSVQWTGYVMPEFAETYNFSITSDDGARLYIDGTLVFDDFLSAAGTYQGTAAFATAGLLYPIQVDWRENTATASIVMSWSSASQSVQVVPGSRLFASATHIKSSPFTIPAV